MFSEDLDEILKKIFKICKIAMANGFVGEVDFPVFTEDIEPLAEFSIKLSEDCTEKEAQKLALMLYPTIYKWVFNNDGIPIFLIGVRNTNGKRLSFRFAENSAQLEDLPNKRWYFDV